MGFPLTEYWSFGGRYTLINDKISLDKSTFYTDPDGTGPLTPQCDPLKAGRYLCDEIGTRLTSSVGFSTRLRRYRRHPSDPRPAARPSARISRASAATSVYLRPRADATKYKGFGGGWVFSAHGEGGYIEALQKLARDRAATRSA